MIPAHGRRLAINLFVMVSVLVLGAVSSAPPSSASATPHSHQASHSKAGRIAFSRQLDGGGSQAFTIRPRGNDEQQVAIPLAGEDFGRPVWSHDGTRILFSNIPYFDSDGNLVGFRPATSDPDGSDFHLLTLPERPVDMYCAAWTPDDRRIVCGDEVGLFTMRAADGGGATRLTHNPFGSTDVPIGYSPDGRKLAFIRNNAGDPATEADDTAALLVARSDGSHGRAVTPYGLLLAHELAGGDWSPDGRHLASATTDGRLVIVTVRSKRIATVPLRIEGDYFAVLPSYSPVGTHLAFSLFRGAPADIYTARTDGSDVRQMTSSGTNELFADWSSTAR